MEIPALLIDACQRDLIDPTVSHNRKRLLACPDSRAQAVIFAQRHLELLQRPVSQGAIDGTFLNLALTVREWGALLPDQTRIEDLVISRYSKKDQQPPADWLELAEEVLFFRQKAEFSAIFNALIRNSITNLETFRNSSFIRIKKLPNLGTSRATMAFIAFDPYTS